MRALALDVAAHGGELRFELGRSRQGRQRALGLALGRDGFIAVRGKTSLRLGQRRNSRRMASDLALGGGVQIARGVGLALAIAPAQPRFGFGCRGGDGLRPRRHHGLAAGLDLRAGGIRFAVDVGDPAALGETARGPGRRVRGGGIAVPAPQIALARNQALAGP